MPNIGSCAPLVVVLAGGSGTRLGPLGNLLPKALIPISPVETVLSRLACQLTSVPKLGVLVSTTPKWKPAIGSFVNRLREACTDDIIVQVTVNPEHSTGPVSALRWLAITHPANDYLLCLGDVVFLQNPFDVFSTGVPRSSVITGPLEVGRDGIAEHHDYKLLRLYYRRELCPFDRQHSYSNWSGVACLPRAALLASAPSRSEVLEDFVNTYSDTGNLVSIVLGPAFVNLNEPNDLKRCWAANLK